jgi:hypothetical protein
MQSQQRVTSQLYRGKSMSSVLNAIILIGIAVGSKIRNASFAEIS